MHPEYATPFWTNVKPVCGKCKLSLWRVCILWICEFNKNNLLLVTTKSNKESIQGVAGGTDKTSGECSLC